MAEPIRWGILGTGGIARGFAADLRTCPDARLQAVGSRTAGSAEEFGARYGAAQTYGSYEELVADDDVDIVYVATPHHRHRDDCLLALDAGKAVLCEKPFALNADEAREVAGRARHNGLFCMEAMWTRFLPVVADARARVQRGEIGDLRSIVADFGYPTERRADNRFFNPKLGGGALLDRGVYGVSLAHWFFGPPKTVHGVASISDTGVDEQTAAVLGWPGERMAVLTSSLVARTQNTAMLVGSAGSLTLAEPFYCPPAIRLARYSTPDTTRSRASQMSRLAFAKVGAAKAAIATALRQASGRPGRDEHGYRYEAIEAMRCMRAGELESPTMPLDETIEILETMDEIRAQCGVVYPGELR